MESRGDLRVVCDVARGSDLICPLPLQSSRASWVSTWPDLGVIKRGSFVNESSPQRASLMAAETGGGPACTGGCFKASVARLREAKRNVFLNDSKISKSRIFNSCPTWVKDENRDENSMLQTALEGTVPQTVSVEAQKLFQFMSGMKTLSSED